VPPEPPDRKNMKSNLHLLLLTAALSAALTGSVNAANSTPIIISGQGTINNPQAMSLSGDGTVIVGTDSSSNGWYWTAAGGMVALGGFPGATSDNAPAWDVSRDGSVIVGTAQTDAGWKPVRWTSGTGWVALGELNPGDEGNAFDVSGDGLTAIGRVGGFPFRWTQSGGMVPVSDADWVFDLSSDGGVMVGLDATGETAIRWTAPGSVQLLGVLPGDNASTAFVVTPDGTTVVGNSYNGPVVRLFRWTQASGIVDLGTLPVGERCDPRALSGDASIVVGSCSDLAGTSFIWTAETGILNAKDYFAQKGVDVSGLLDFTNLVSVSENGRVFTGYEWSPALVDGVSWVVVIPPEPVPALSLLGVTALLSSLALIGLSTLRHR
jgi:uncharacterized membrane protein